MDTGSIVSLQTDRPDLYAFEVRGKITKPDITRMADQLKVAFERQNTVDVLIVITSWDGIELGAVFDTNALSAQAQANSHVRKYAVVGAPGWAEAMINIFSPLTPVHEKTFELEEVHKAWKWVSE